MPPRCDGGTRFFLDLETHEVANFTPEFAAAVAEARRIRSKDEKAADRARGGRRIHLPWSQGELFEGPPPAEPKCTGEHREIVTFYIPEVAFVRLDLESSPSSDKRKTARVTVEFKARQLHSELDQRKIVFAFLREVHWWVTGDFKITPEQLHPAGWTTGNIELCADFVDLHFLRDDAVNFVVPRGMKVGDEGSKRRKTWGKDRTFAETVMLGNRSSEVSLCCYGKTTQIEEVKDGDASAYEWIWRLYDWDGKQNLGRVEIRLRGRGGLVWMDRETGEIFDLRDPMVATDPAIQREAFGWQTSRFRLVDPTSHSRMKNCRTQARWNQVMAAVNVEPRQVKQVRPAQADAHANAMYRANRKQMRDLISGASLAGQKLKLSTAEGVASWAQHVWEQLTPDEIAELEDFGARRYEDRRVTMGPEIDAQAKLFATQYPNGLPGIEPRIPKHLSTRPPPFVEPDRWRMTEVRA